MPSDLVKRYHLFDEEFQSSLTGDQEWALDYFGLGRSLELENEYREERKKKAETESKYPCIIVSDDSDGSEDVFDINLQNATERLEQERKERMKHA
jgi:hypothetical protein